MAEVLLQNKRDVSLDNWYILKFACSSDDGMEKVVKQYININMASHTVPVLDISVMKEVLEDSLNIHSKGVGKVKSPFLVNVMVELVGIIVCAVGTVVMLFLAVLGFRVGSYAVNILI